MEKSVRPPEEQAMLSAAIEKPEVRELGRELAHALDEQFQRALLEGDQTLIEDLNERVLGLCEILDQQWFKDNPGETMRIRSAWNLEEALLHVPPGGTIRVRKRHGRIERVIAVPPQTGEA